MEYYIRDNMLGFYWFYMSVNEKYHRVMNLKAFEWLIRYKYSIWQIYPHMFLLEIICFKHFLFVVVFE